MSDILQTSVETGEPVSFDEHDVHEWAGRVYACDEIVSRVVSGEFKTLDDVTRYATAHVKQMESRLDAIGALSMFVKR